jgi:hypothetical protein
MDVHTKFKIQDMYDNNVTLKFIAFCITRTGSSIYMLHPYLELMDLQLVFIVTSI